MSQTVTVSNGSEFYQIPVTDLLEASHDGFYLPVTRGCTIVADSHSAFEIPYSDLTEAAADGFHDLIVAEAETVTNVCRVLHPSVDLTQLIDSAASARGCQKASSRGSGRAGKDEPQAVPKFVFVEHRPQAKLQQWEASRFVFGTAYPDGGLQLEDDVECDDLSADDVAVEADDEQPEDEGLVQFIRSKRFRKLIATNGAVHLLALMILALIALPARPSNFTLDGKIVEPDLLEELALHEVNFEPEPILPDPLPAETDEELAPIDVLTALEDNLRIEPGLPDVSVPEVPPEPEAPAATAPVTSTATAANAAPQGEFGGRTAASRKAKLQQFGGTPASEAAVLAGLKWLQRHQRYDGSWSFDHRHVGCDCRHAGTAVTCDMGATGLALMAFLGAGHTPHEGQFKDNVRRGVLYLLKNAKETPNGIDLRGRAANDIGIQTGGMYVHGIATTALCEALGMSKHSYRASMDPRREFDRRVRPVAKGAVKFILNAQHRDNGSWGYRPGLSGDTSIIGWQVMALVSASHIGIAVPRNAEKGVTRFLDLVQSNYGSRYGYTDANPRASTTSIGLLCRMLLGWVRSDPRLKAGVEYLSQLGPAANSMYYNFYATQVLHQYGGPMWKKWNPIMRDHLVSTQSRGGHEDGSWLPADAHGQGPGGRHYMTCMAVMTLEVYYRHMPIYKPEVTLATKPDGATE